MCIEDNRLFLSQSNVLKCVCTGAAWDLTNANAILVGLASRVKMVSDAWWYCSNFRNIQPTMRTFRRL